METVKLFFAALACIVPISFAIGMIPMLLLTPLLRNLHRQTERGSKKSKVDFRWPEWLIVSLLTGFVSFPLTRRFTESSLTLGGTIAVAVALLLFAFLVPVMSADTFTGDTETATKNNLLAFWIGLAGGGILGAITTLLWF